jgi:hypothetical protein
MSDSAHFRYLGQEWRRLATSPQDALFLRPKHLQSNQSQRMQSLNSYALTGHKRQAMPLSVSPSTAQLSPESKSLSSDQSFASLLQSQRELEQYNASETHRLAQQQRTQQQYAQDALLHSNASLAQSMTNTNTASKQQQQKSSSNSGIATPEEHIANLSLATPKSDKQPTKSVLQGSSSAMQLMASASEAVAERRAAAAQQQKAQALKRSASNVLDELFCCCCFDAVFVFVID